MTSTGCRTVCNNWHWILWHCEDTSVVYR